MARDLSVPVESKLTGADNLPDSQHYNILVTGVTGYGKSTLVSGITGRTYTDSDKISSVDTVEVTSTDCSLSESATATLWDTPGLLGGSKSPKHILRQMAEKCPCHDLVIHCMKCTDTRLISGHDNSGILSIEILTKHFEVTFWENAIFALTFANNMEQYRPAWRNLTSDEKQESFRKEIDEWDSFIRHNLTEYAEVPQSIADTVSVIPVGHYTVPTLMNGQNWSENFKSLCDKSCRQSRSTSGQQNSKVDSKKTRHSPKIL